MAIAQGFQKVKRDDHVRTAGRDERTVSAVNPDMRLDTAASLSHAVCLGGTDIAPFEYACLAYDVGRKYGSLTADAHDKQIKAAVFPGAFCLWVF